MQPSYGREINNRCWEGFILGGIFRKTHGDTKSLREGNTQCVVNSSEEAESSGDTSDYDNL